MKIRVLFALAAFAATASLVSAQDSNNQMMGHDMGGQAMMEANEKMMSAMQGMQPSGSTDKDFATMMIDHHQGAIDMAKVELEHGEDPQLKAMAEKIIDAQEQEIAEFEAWLAENGQ